MRIDHIAFRTNDRWATAKFFIEAFGYTVQEEFDLQFDDGTTTKCIALQPSQKKANWAPWTFVANLCPPELEGVPFNGMSPQTKIEYWLAPEIFVSDSNDPESIVGKWVANRGGVGGIHHIAWQVDSVEKTMAMWREKGYAEFTTEKPITCEENPLVQVFTKPSDVCGGIIFELIERKPENAGFCGGSVIDLMKSTKDYS